MYYIGIDWGQNKTGLAIADNELKIATVLPEVKTADLITQIQNLKKEYKEIKIIFGYLGQAAQFNTSQDKEIKRSKKIFLEKIKNLEIKVIKAEEMLSTKMAQQNILASGKKMVSKKDNSESAKIILQGWLDIHC
jgi:putative transcription antitermination factor YqgF